MTAKKKIQLTENFEYMPDLTLKGNATHLTENDIHSALNGLELGDATFLTLDVLAQGTKSCESGPTSRGWADVNLVLMDRACKMLVQGC